MYTFRSVYNITYPALHGFNSFSRTGVFRVNCLGVHNATVFNLGCIRSHVRVILSACDFLPVSPTACQGLLFRRTRSVIIFSISWYLVVLVGGPGFTSGEGGACDPVCVWPRELCMACNSFVAGSCIVILRKCEGFPGLDVLVRIMMPRQQDLLYCSYDTYIFQCWLVSSAY